MMFVFFNDTATTEIYTLSLHDALPISGNHRWSCADRWVSAPRRACDSQRADGRVHRGDDCSATPDRKSTRLNSSHANISYAVFCLKKKNYKISVVLVDM